MSRTEEVCLGLIAKWFPEITEPKRAYDAVQAIVRAYHSWDWEKDLICCRVYWDELDAEKKPLRKPPWMTRLVNWARKHPEFRKEQSVHEPAKQVPGMIAQFDPKSGKLLGYKKLE